MQLTLMASSLFIKTNLSVRISSLEYLVLKRVALMDREPFLARMMLYFLTTFFGMQFLLEMVGRINSDSGITTTIQMIRMDDMLSISHLAFIAFFVVHFPQPDRNR